MTREATPRRRAAEEGVAAGSGRSFLACTAATAGMEVFRQGLRAGKAGMAPIHIVNVGARFRSWLGGRDIDTRAGAVPSGAGAHIHFGGKTGRAGGGGGPTAMVTATEWLEG